MSTSMYFEEFEVGRRYPTYTRTITEADLVLFCSLVGYHNPMFIDAHYAKKTRFGGRIRRSKGRQQQDRLEDRRQQRTRGNADDFDRASGYSGVGRRLDGEAGSIGSARRSAG